MTDLNQKIRSKSNKAKNNADDVLEGPNTMSKNAKNTTYYTEHSTDQKFLGKGAKSGKGKFSGEEKSSGDSDPNKGPIIPAGKGKKGK